MYVAKRQLSGRSAVTTPDILNNANQVIEENPHISSLCLSQQISTLPLEVNISSTFINFGHTNSYYEPNCVTYLYSIHVNNYIDQPFIPMKHGF